MNQTGSAASTTGTKMSRWVTFMLEHETYGIDVMQIREVIRSAEISPVPGSPDYVLGIINLRGNVVAIIDTRKRFGLTSREMDDASRILILEAGDYVVGFLVDSVSEVAELSNDKVEAAPDTGGGHNTSRFITGLYNRPEGLLIMIDASRLLSEEEMTDIASF